MRSSNLLKSFAVALALSMAVPAFSAIASSSVVAERPEKEQMSLLLTMLSAHEYRPSAKVLARIGSTRSVTRLLIFISNSPKYRPTIRVRALATLYLLPADNVRKYLLSVVHERENTKSNLGTLLRKQALRSLGRGFGKSVVTDLVAVKGDTNGQIREGVAQALGDTGAKEALPYLKAWLPNEKELFVRLAIDNAIEVIRKGSR